MTSNRSTRSSTKREEVSKNGVEKRELDESDVMKNGKKPVKRAKVSSLPKPVRVPGSAKRINKIPELPTERLNVYVFGSGSMNELGMGEEEMDVVYRPRLNPILSTDKVGVVDLAVGGMHSAALSHDGRVYTWGVNDDYALGRLTKDQKDENGDKIDNDLLEGTPSKVEGALSHLRVTKVICSDNLTAAITDNGCCFTWGTFRCSDGVLGYSDSQKRTAEPTQMRLPEICQLATGTDHIIALTTTGKVYTWGNGQQFQLGRRMLERRRLQGLTPQPLALKNIISVGAGSYHSFAIDNKGRVYAWGLNITRQCGIEVEDEEEGAVITKPTLVDALEGYNVKSITGGEHHTLALLEDGRVLAWGRDDRHQLGIPDDALPETVVKDEKGNNYYLSTPTIIPGLTNVIQVVCGTHHNLAVTSDGKVYSWGSAENYEVGQGDNDEDVAVPTLVRSKAIKEVAIRVAGAGGQFSIIAGIPNASEEPVANGIKSEPENEKKLKTEETSKTDDSPVTDAKPDVTSNGEPSTATSESKDSVLEPSSTTA